MKVYEDQVHLVEVDESRRIVISKKKNGIKVTVCGNNYLVLEPGEGCKIEQHLNGAKCSFVVGKIDE